MPKPANDREALLVKLISAVMANASPNGEQINLNVSVAMEMVDKVLVDYEIFKIKQGRRN